jgi:hypothetical protein
MSETTQTPPAGDQSTQSQTTSDTQAQTQAPVKTAAEWEAEAREARKEAQALRDRAKAAEAKIEEAANKDLTDKERATKAAADAEARATALEQRVITAELKSEAVRLGFTDPTDAIKLIDRSQLDVKDGEVTNADTLLKALAKAKPYLLKTAEPSPPGGRNPHGGGEQAQDKERKSELSKRFGIRT